ncbi:hypothetical protein [Nibrella viscosa]
MWVSEKIFQAGIDSSYLLFNVLADDNRKKVKIREATPAKMKQGLL